MTIPPYAIATVLTVLWAYLSQRTGRRAPFVLVSSSVAIIGYIILFSDHRPSVSYGGTILAAAGIYPSVALSLAWPAANVSGQTKRAVACAMQITIGNLGAVLGTQLYRPITSPRYYLGHGFACGYLVANLIVTSIIWAVLSWENKRRDQAGNGQWESGLQDYERENWEGDADPRWRFST
jgi:Na+/melibiose symporter-like transporter